MISTENESPPRSGSTEPSLRQSREPGLTEAEMGREESYMRVEAYNQVQQLYQTKKVNKTRQTGSESRTDFNCSSAALGRISVQRRQRLRELLPSGRK